MTLTNGIPQCNPYFYSGLRTGGPERFTTPYFSADKLKRATSMCKVDLARPAQK